MVRYQLLCSLEGPFDDLIFYSFGGCCCSWATVAFYASAIASNDRFIVFNISIQGRFYECFWPLKAFFTRQVEQLEAF